MSMRPYGLDEYELLEMARMRSEMLREEWRVANRSTGRRFAGANSPGLFKRARIRTGGALVEFGRRLIASGGQTPRIAAGSAGRDLGC